MLKNTTRIATIAALAAMTAGCYVVPVQVEQGKPPVYAYAPIPARQTAPQASAPMPAAPVVVTVTPGTLQVRLYPMNEAAAQFGALHGFVVDAQNGRGTFALQTASELMQGEATRVPDNFPGFGRVLGEVLGGETVPAAGSRKGVANAYGSRGMFANCEYVLSTRNLGTGACAFSNGARYQIHFGG